MKRKVVADLPHKQALMKHNKKSWRDRYMYVRGKDDRKVFKMTRRWKKSFALHCRSNFFSKIALLA
jgi:nuclear transport factor 2 (NTF2) superfamily protein